MINFSCNGINFLFRESENNSWKKILFATMINKLLNYSVLLSSFSSFHIVFGYFFYELINCSLVHEFYFLLSSVVIIETSLFDFFLFFLLESFFDILLISWCEVDLMFQVIVFFLQKSTVGFLDGMELVKDIQRMFQRHRSVESFHNINHSSFGSSNPVCKLHVIWYGGT